MLLKMLCYVLRVKIVNFYTDKFLFRCAPAYILLAEEESTTIVEVFYYFFLGN